MKRFMKLRGRLAPVLALALAAALAGCKQEREAPPPPHMTEALKACGLQV